MPRRRAARSRPTAAGSRTTPRIALSISRRSPVEAPDGSRPRSHIRASRRCGLPIRDASRSWCGSHDAYAIVVQPLDGSANEIRDQRPPVARRRTLRARVLARWRLVYGLANPQGEQTGTTLWAQALSDRGAGVGSAVSIARFPGASISHLSVPLRGSQIAALITSTEGDIYSGALTAERKLAGSPERVTADDCEDRGAAWLDDKTLLFASDCSGRFGIYAQDIAHGSIPSSDRPRAHGDVAGARLRCEPVLLGDHTRRRERVMVTPTTRATPPTSARAGARHPASPRPPPIGLSLSCATAPSTRRGGRVVTIATWSLRAPCKDYRVDPAGHTRENWDWALRRDGQAIAYPNGNELGSSTSPRA